MAPSTSASFPTLSHTVPSSRTIQLVVIAKPSPGRPYRQLASAFQSCSCTQSILIPCLNALRALSDQSNRFGVLQELKFAAECQAAGADLTMWANEFYQTTDQKDADCRFPYIAATLVSSMATSCLSQDHIDYDCSLETPFHVAGSEADEGDLYDDCREYVSVGVIDITNPEEPRYCFLDLDKKCIKCGVWWFGVLEDHIMDVYLPWEVTDYTPLSCDAIQSHMEEDDDATVRSQIGGRELEVKALKALDTYPVIDIAALANCWPAKAWNSMGQLDVYSTQASISTDEADEAAHKRGVKSLGDLCRETILDGILTEYLHDLDYLDESMRLLTFPQRFLSVCARRVTDLATFGRQEMVADLLALLLEGIDHVDLYPFRQLPVSTILLILHSDRLKGMKSLNLSGLFVGCPEEIWRALDIIPELPDVVYLLSPPSADKASEEEAVLNSFPPYTGSGTFWERMGSTKIIMSAAISTSLVSHCSTRPSTNLGWKKSSISHLRESLSGDTYRLQRLPQDTWWERHNYSWTV